MARIVTTRELLPQQVRDTRYTFDPSGNITKITDTTDTGEPSDTQCFTYDHLQRLTAAWTPASGDCTTTPSASTLGGPEPYWYRWTYDKAGNRTSETRTTPQGTWTATYTYPTAGQPHPHALQKVTTTGPNGTRTDTYTYDQAGNTTSRTIGTNPTEAFTFNSEGTLEKITKDGATTTFIADADGNRLIQRDTNGTTLYLGNTEVRLKADGTVTATRYYEHGGQLVAMRTPTNLYWLGTDHHGTIDLIIDAANQQIQRLRTTPFGTPRTQLPEGWPTNRTFLGAPTDPTTGLIHLGAREYDPTTGRFLSVDPLAHYEDPQQLHGYAYANNNPVTYSDPTGEIAWVPVIIIAIRVIPIVIRVVRYVPTIIRVVTPVLRPIMARGWSLLRGFFSRIAGWVVTHIVKFKTVIKRIVNWVRKFVKKRVKIVKKKPVKTTKKPRSTVKKPAKKHNRNTHTPKKTTPKKAKQPTRSLSKPKPRPHAKKPDTAPKVRGNPKVNNSNKPTIHHSRPDGSPPRFTIKNEEELLGKPRSVEDTTPLVGVNVRQYKEHTPPGATNPTDGPDPAHLSGWAKARFYIGTFLRILDQFKGQ